MVDIQITNAKMHNLKGVNVRIPRNSLTVVTGLSGSGKSSLAFDTLYAEGQRRYVESLSAYARQFLDRLQKPDVERIEGLSPAIAIEQRTSGGNPRSIVATVTEIHDYLRILYGSIGIAHCPKCGKPVRRQSAEEIVETILKYPTGAKLVIYAPVVAGRKGRHEDALATVRRNGFVRVRVDGTTYPVEDVPELDKKKNHSIDVVVDRLVMPAAGDARADATFVTRLTDSVELGLKTGNGLISVQRLAGGDLDEPEETVFSEKNACPDCGLSFDELKPRSFSFNSPFGACPTCGGLGSLFFFDEDLVVPDKSLPLQECIHPWRRAGHNAIIYYNALLEQIAKQYKVRLSTPYEKLPASFRKKLMHGFDDDLVLPWRSVDKPFEGVLATLQKRLENAESDEAREKLEAYQSDRVCPACHGTRLRPESRAVTVGDKTIVEVMAMSVRDALAFFKGLDGLKGLNGPLGDILKEIVRRLGFLNDVGLDYLSLDRPSATLSGGEMQRIRLATQIGSGLTGVLYVLDEPTIGLHPRDNERLIAMLRELRDRGNTVVVVEHDAEMMKTADWIVDLGPGAGREGGNVMYQGDYKGLLKCGSLTADYLTGRKAILPEHSSGISTTARNELRQMAGSAAVRKPELRQIAGSAAMKKPELRSGAIEISGCCHNNLKNVTAHIPLGSFTVVTGVSGSGKSSLIDETLLSCQGCAGQVPQAHRHGTSRQGH